MSPNLKALGLALLTALAMSAAATSSASAESFAFHSAAPHTDLSGVQAGTHVFTADGGSATCKSVSHASTMASEEASEIALTAAFTECSADPLGTAEVAMNGCQFVLAPATREGETYKANLAVACEGGKTVDVVAKALGVTKCTVHIPPQTLGEVTLSEVSEGEVTLVADVEGIDYNQTAGTGLGACAKAESKTNGLYEGTTTLAGHFGAYEAPIGLQALKPAISVEPPEVFFGGKDDEKTITVENVSGAKLAIVTVGWDKAQLDAVADNCTGKEVDKDKSCTVKLKCNNPVGKPSLLHAISDNPRDIDSAVLKGC